MNTYLRIILTGGLSLFLLTACGDSNAAVTPPAVTAQVGSTALDTSTASGSDQAGGTAAAQAAPTATLVPAVLSVGDTVTAQGQLRIYSEADARVPAMGEYAAGATFSVVEPTDEFAAYPVEIDGVRWYRVRAEDGLVGWVLADGIQ